MYTSHRYVKTVVVKHYLWIMVPSIKAISGMYKIEWTVGMIAATFNCYHLMSVLNRSQKKLRLIIFSQVCKLLHVTHTCKVLSHHSAHGKQSEVKGHVSTPQEPGGPEGSGEPPANGTSYDPWQQAWSSRYPIQEADWSKRSKHGPKPREKIGRELSESRRHQTKQ